MEGDLSSPGLTPEDGRQQIVARERQGQPGVCGVTAGKLREGANGIGCLMLRTQAERGPWVKHAALTL